jgi:Uma2 family endonuclease
MSWVNTSPLVKTYTLEEFWELPDPPDHSKLELIAGVLYMTPPPGYKHDNAVSRLLDLLPKFLAKTENQGRIHVPRAAIWTSPSTYLEPDLFYVSVETEAQQNPKQRSTADLVVEVISPGSAIYDRNTKADTYAALGVKELWLIDESTQTVEVRVLVDGQLQHGDLLEKDDIVRSQVLSGLEFPARRLFED